MAATEHRVPGEEIFVQDGLHFSGFAVACFEVAIKEINLSRPDVVECSHDSHLPGFDRVADDAASRHDFRNGPLDVVSCNFVDKSFNFRWRKFR